MLVDITRQKPFKMGEHIFYKGKSTTLSDNTRPMQIQIVKRKEKKKSKARKQRNNENET